MNGQTPSNDSSPKNFVLLVPSVFLFFLILWIGAETIFPPGAVLIFRPTYAIVISFFIFSLLLKKKVGDNLFGEIGFLYLALTVAYTLFPAFGFMAMEMDSGVGWIPEKLTRLIPTASALATHFWRHVIFVVGVATGYLIFRGHRETSVCDKTNSQGDDGLMIIFLLSMVVICLLSLSLFSAPVTTYIENYTRYDHLSWVLRKYISLCTRLKIGIYTVFLTFLFINYKKYKLIIPFVITFFCVYEIIFSFGSRIEALIILMVTLCLYNNNVKIISVKKGLIAFMILAALFTGVEIFRAAGFKVSAAQDVVTTDGVKPAGEFIAVYFTGFHLYAERTQDTLPDREWPMLFNDFISMFTFSDFTEWNPQYWYARNYFPEAVVPPETMGPIAESAIWGGELDLVLRSLLNGVFFAYLVRWFQGRKNKWWALAIYVYCFATCVMTLKYSIFYHLGPLVKTMLPTLLAVAGVNRLIALYRKRMIACPMMDR